MEFHRPKAFANFGEFLREYAIIVTGVLTALALEAGLLAVHDRQAAGEARENIRAEIATDLGFLDIYASTQACVTRRFDEIEDLIDHPPHSGAPIWIGHPVYFLLREEQYRAAQSAGRVSLMPSEEQGEYARVFTFFSEFNAALAREDEAIADLNTLELHPAMTPEVAWRLRSALAQAKAARWRMEVAASPARKAATRLGVSARAMKGFSVQSFCVPINTPRAEALKLVAAGRGGQAFDEP